MLLMVELIYYLKPSSFYAIGGGAEFFRIIPLIDFSIGDRSYHKWKDQLVMQKH